jgi:hypothetical protein
MPGLIGILLLQMTSMADKPTQFFYALSFGYTLLSHTSKHFLLKKLTEQTHEDIFHFL